jgi:ATP-dependent DNA ligase
MNVVALPVDRGYATLGHLVEREHVVEAIRSDGTSLKLVGEVKFTEWTSEGEMRHPAFLGLRSDKTAFDVIREQA